MGLPGGGSPAGAHPVGLGAAQRRLELVLGGLLEASVACGFLLLRAHGRGPERARAVAGQAGAAPDHAVQPLLAPGQAGVLGPGADHVRVGGLHRAQRGVDDAFAVARDVFVQLPELAHAAFERRALASLAFVRGHAHPLRYRRERALGRELVDCFEDRPCQMLGCQLPGLVVEVPAVDDAHGVRPDQLADVLVGLLPVASPVRLFQLAQVPSGVDQAGQPVGERGAVLHGSVHDLAPAPFGAGGRAVPAGERVLALVRLRVAHLGEAGRVRLLLRLGALQMAEHAVRLHEQRPAPAPACICSIGF